MQEDSRSCSLPVDINQRQWRIVTAMPSSGRSKRTPHMKTENKALRYGYHAGSTDADLPAGAARITKSTQHLSTRDRMKKTHCEEEERAPTYDRSLHLHTNFASALKSTPPTPPILLHLCPGRRPRPGCGKVRVLLRLSRNSKYSAHFVQVCPKRKQVTLSDPVVHMKNQPTSKQSPLVSKKTFSFDAVFRDFASQSEVCRSSLVKVLHSVLTGSDGCVVSYGQAKLGKTFTMVGQDDAVDMYGVIPTGIVWLFRLVDHLQQKTKCDFAIGVSALEVNSLTNQVSDLLTDDHVGSSGLLHSSASVESFSQTVLGVMSLEAAAYYFDCALQTWRNVKKECDAHLAETKHSNFCFTVHILRKMTDSSGKNVVLNSRLYMWDLGSCDQIQSMSCKQQDVPDIGSLSSLGGVLLALLNREKCIPHRENKLTQLLQESVGNASCHTSLIVHISSLPQHYHETLGVLELVARIHKRKQQRSRVSETSSSEEDCSSVEDFHHSRRHRNCWRLVSSRTRFPGSGCGSGLTSKQDAYLECSEPSQQQLSIGVNATDQTPLSRIGCSEKENIKDPASMGSAIDSAQMNSEVEAIGTIADDGQDRDGLSVGVCTVDKMTSSGNRRFSAAESYMLDGPSLGDVKHVVKANSNEEPHNSAMLSEKEERGDPAGQSDSAGHSPSPALLPSPNRPAEKSLGKCLLLPVDEHSRLSLSHPHYQELTEYVNTLLQHSPQPPLLSAANQRKRTTSLRLPSGSSWTSTPSVSRQRTVSERGDSTVDNKSVVSKTSNRANAYRQKVCDSPYSHIASVSCVGCGNTSDYSTTTAGTGTLTSLLGRLLTFGSRDGFASSFLPPEGSLHSVVHPGAGESCKKDHRADAPFTRSSSARYTHNRRTEESTLKRFGGSFTNGKRASPLSGAAGKRQDLEAGAAPDLSKYSFDNLRPDKLDARLRKRQMIQCKVSKLAGTEKQNYSAEVTKEPNPLHRSLSTQSAPVRRLASSSKCPHHNHQHSKQRGPAYDATKTNDEVVKRIGGNKIEQHEQHDSAYASSSGWGQPHGSSVPSSRCLAGNRASFQSAVSSTADSVFDSDHTCKSSTQILSKKSKFWGRKRQVFKSDHAKDYKLTRSRSGDVLGVSKGKNEELDGRDGLSCPNDTESSDGVSVKGEKDKSKQKKPWHARLLSRLLGRKKKLRRMNSEDGLVLSLTNRQEHLRLREDLQSSEKDKSRELTTVKTWTENGKTLIAC